MSQRVYEGVGSLTENLKRMAIGGEGAAEQPPVPVPVPAQPFGIGPAIVGAAESGVERLPDLWLADLRDALGPDGRTALAQTCRSGLEWMLLDAPRATKEVRLTMRMRDIYGYLTRLTQQLHLRGGDTTLIFLGDLSVNKWIWVFRTIASDGRIMCAVSIHFEFPQITRRLITIARGAFRDVPSLVLCGRGGEIRGGDGGSADDRVEVPWLPLLGLTSITVGRVAEPHQYNLWATLVHLRTLTSITILPQPAEAVRPNGTPLWRHMLSVAFRLQSVVELRVPSVLDLSLAEWCRTHYPGLRYLGVPNVEEAGPGVVMGGDWGIGTIEVGSWEQTEGGMGGGLERGHLGGHTLELTSLLWLARRPEGAVRTFRADRMSLRHGALEQVRSRSRTHTHACMYASCAIHHGHVTPDAAPQHTSTPCKATQQSIAHNICAHMQHMQHVRSCAHSARQMRGFAMTVCSHVPTCNIFVLTCDMCTHPCNP